MSRSMRPRGVPSARWPLVCLLAGIGADAAALGAWRLDNYTFDKSLQFLGLTLFVKFDEMYPHGDKEDEFKTLCTLAYPVPRFFVAEVPIQDYGTLENDALRERFKLTKEDYPAFFLFSPENKEGVRYEGDVKVDELILWLRQHGIKMSSVGTIVELDEVVQKFFLSGLEGEHISVATELAKTQYSTDRKAPMYVKIMEKIKEKGEAYVATESARVSKLLQGKVTPEKRAELGDKAKVLNVFANRGEEL